MILLLQTLELIGSRRNDRYEAALEALREDTRGWWADRLECDPDHLDEGEAPYEADAGHLRRFIETQVMPWYGQRRIELENRSLIREQAFGESLKEDKLEVLTRYEMHLDRKLQRMLTMLLKLRKYGLELFPPSQFRKIRLLPCGSGQKKSQFQELATTRALGNIGHRSQATVASRYEGRTTLDSA